MATTADVVVFLARASYYISLLGLKIPLGLLARASHSRYVLAWILFAWIPFLFYSHAVLLPKVPTLPQEIAVLVWHGLTALWVTIPLLTVGGVVLSRVQSRGPVIAFFAALATVVAFHALVIPVVATTAVGGLALHALFAFFEDMPIVGWVWCLYHVVCLQNHVAKTQANRPTPFTEQEGPLDRVLIVGNAPTVVEGEPYGHLIDDFSHVVRFNQYSITKPEYTGVRVGYHFCNGRNFPTDKTVQAICPLFNASLTHSVYLFMPHMEEARSIYANLTSIKVDAWFVEEEHVLALRKKIGNRIWQIPTSGMVAIDAFLRQRKEVTLHGFNFFQGKKIHYFEESPLALVTSWLERFVTHDPSIEKVWVASLREEGRISLLSKDSTRASNDDEKEEETAQKKHPKSPCQSQDEDASLRRRTPGLIETLLKDGLPSQFSL